MVYTESTRHEPFHPFLSSAPSPWVKRGLWLVPMSRFSLSLPMYYPVGVLAHPDSRKKQKKDYFLDDIMVDSGISDHTFHLNSAKPSILAGGQVPRQRAHLE